MLWVFGGLDLLECDRMARKDLPAGYIDLSKTRACDIPEAIRTIQSHHANPSIYIGYLDPLWMLTPPQEVLCRSALRSCTVGLVVSNPLILPLSWKNGTDRLVIVSGNKNQDEHDADNSSTLNDRRAPLVFHEAGHRQDVAEHSP